MQKHERQQLIRELIQREQVRSQTELSAMLAKSGVVATQASVSRDLDEMGVVKVHGTYTFAGSKGRGSEFGPVALQPVGSNLIVAKTMSGLASAVTVRIDSARIPGIVGTIAGDDTIFIAVEDQKKQLAALRQIKGVFN
jgi:transcriptional regulator of arginine metabolism